MSGTRLSTNVPTDGFGLVNFLLLKRAIDIV